MQIWEDNAIDVMRKAAEVEKELALAAKDVNADSIPMITVVADGSWSKRLYRNNYNSLSRAAAIVGYRTKNVL